MQDEGTLGNTLRDIAPDQSYDGTVFSAIVDVEEDMEAVIVPARGTSFSKLAYFAVSGSYMVDSEDVWGTLLPLFLAENLF